MNLDLGDLFTYSMSPLELVVRGSLVYWFLFAIFRFILRRDVGSMGVGDFLFVVLLGDAAQNGMIGDATSPIDAMTLIGTLVAWNLLIDWATYRFPVVERLMAPPRRCLVRDGRVDRRTMRREFITQEELMAQVRSHGLEDLAQVKRAYLESDGDMSIIQRDGAPPEAKPARPAP